MVDFIRKRLQVFVSSTYDDLRNERQAAVEAILTAGHIPAGMELFTSGDESQMEVINQWIDESDVYLLILGGRYGSIEPKTGKSYIHLEYEYALDREKPLFACVIKGAALEDRVRAYGTSVFETANPQKLEEFRGLVLTKLVRFWEDAKDIKIAIGETLSQFSRRDDLTGWVRVSQEANMPALADELARLSKENAQLRSQITKEEAINGLSFDELKALLENKGLLSFLEGNRSQLGSHRGVMENESSSLRLRELHVLGLLKHREKTTPPWYQLTDAGRRFLNRLLAQQLATQSKDENDVNQ